MGDEVENPLFKEIVNIVYVLYGDFNKSKDAATKIIAAISKAGYICHRVYVPLRDSADICVGKGVTLILSRFNEKEVIKRIMDKEALAKLVEQMPRVTDEELKQLWLENEHGLGFTGVSIADYSDEDLPYDQSIAQAQQEADAEWIVEQGLVQLPNREHMTALLRRMRTEPKQLSIIDQDMEAEAHWLLKQLKGIE